MRRQLRRHLPELAHWFGILPADVDHLTYGELQQFVDRLGKCPPVGSVFQVFPKE